MDSATNYPVRRWFSVDPLKCVFIGLLVLCLISDFYLARSLVPNADSIQNYGQLLAVRDGNVFLRHWVLTSDNFYFTDLLPFVLLSFVFGTGLNLVYIVPFFVHCLFILCCFLLVTRAARNRTERYFGLFSVLFLLGLPYGPQLDLLLRSAIHTGTITFSLYAVLLAYPILSNRTFKYYTLIPFTILVFAVAASDPFSDFFLVIPLLMLIILRTWLFQKFLLGEWALFGCTVLGTSIGTYFIRFLGNGGGFSTAIAFSTNFVSSMQGLELNAHAVLRAVQILFTARTVASSATIGQSFVVGSRLITVIICILLCFSAVWKMPRKSETGAIQFFILSAVVLAIADSLSTTFTVAISDGAGFPNAAIRYVTPIYIFMSLAATLEAQRIFFSIRPQALRNIISGIVVLAALPFFGEGALAANKAAHSPPGTVAAQQADLTKWLMAHNFRYGLGNYWTSQMILNLSQGKIITNPAISSGKTLVLFQWNCDTSLWNKLQPPQFFVLSAKDNLFGITVDTVYATYGTPQKIDHVGPYTVLQYIAP